MILNRHRILAAIGGALAVVPAAAMPGVPWWVAACGAAGAFFTLLAKPGEVAPGKKDAP